MEQDKKKSLLLTIPQILAVFIVCMTLEAPLEFYSGQGVAWGLILFRLLSVLCPLFAVDLLYRTGVYIDVYSGKAIIYFVALCMWSVACFIMDRNALSMFNALIYFGIPFGACLSEADIRLSVFRKPFVYVCAIGIVCFFYVWFTYNIDLAAALRRGYTWTDIFFWSRVFWGIIPIVLYFFIRGEKLWMKLLAVGYWICGIIFNLIFIKRFILVDSVLLLGMLLMYLLFARKIDVRMFFGGVLLLVAAFVIYGYMQGSVIDTLLDAVTGRFEDSSVKDLDRLVESKNYFKSADLVDILFGRGLFGTHDSLSSLTDALHIGWTDYIFRGGVFLFAFALVPTLRAVTLLPSMDLLDTRTQWAVCITCIYAVKLLYGNMHNHSPELTFVFFAYAVVMKWRFDGNEGAYGNR